MAKNKNKNKNKNSNQGNKNVESRSKVVTDFTQEQVDKIDKFLEEEMPTEAIELSDEELVETKEDAQKIEDIKKTGNVDGYINKLHDMLVRIKAIEKKADEIETDKAVANTMVWLGFVVPIIGFIYAATNSKSNPATAKATLVASIIGFIIEASIFLPSMFYFLY